MKTVAVLSRKGGAGKTTVALSVALAAQQAGLRVVVADVDPLHSAAEVLRGRPEAASLLIETSAAKLFVVQQACRQRGCDLLIVDTPTAPEADVVLAINVADLCIAVTRPTSLDVAAVQHTVGLLRRMGGRGLVVLNQCPPRRNGAEASLVQRTLEALHFCGTPLAASRLRSRAAYQHAFTHKRSVTEWDPASEAAADVLRLLAEVTDHLMAPDLDELPYLKAMRR